MKQGISVTIQLRPYQQQLKADIYNSWQQGNRNVLAVLPTGGGKTMCFADIVLDHHNAGQRCAVIAHRNELVTQMSTTIASRGIPHRIIGSNVAIAQTVRRHREKFGKSFVNPSASTAVIGVDTLVARKDSVQDWVKQIDLWIVDESQHLLRANKWGTAAAMFTNARGLGVSATPSRADGQGLGEDTDGVFHDMVSGPSTRWLIEQGFLADYEIVCPESDLRVDDSPLSKDGDWSNQTLRKAAKQSHIVGDVVQNYCVHAFGRKAIVFATDVETASEISRSFNESGVKAACLHGKSLPAWREQSLRQFESGDLMVLVNVDLFDEGLDIGCAEVCIMARPTASLVKFLQSIGRVLRPQPNKVALIIDHVSNVIRHKLPDRERIWTLDRRDKRGKQAKDPDEIQLTVCKGCRKPYEAFRTACPYCGAQKPLPDPRSRSIEMVEGDLILLDREMLAKLRAATALESAADVGNRVANAAGAVAGKGAANRQGEKIVAHSELQEAIALWAGYERMRGYSDREIQRRFYLTMGRDVVSALDGSQTRAELQMLTNVVRRWVKCG